MNVDGILESAQTAVLSTVHAPIGKGGKNWVTRSAPHNTGQLPAYIQLLEYPQLADKAWA